MWDSKTSPSAICSPRACEKWANPPELKQHNSHPGRLMRTFGHMDCSQEVMLTHSHGRSAGVYHPTVRFRSRWDQWPVALEMKRDWGQTPDVTILPFFTSDWQSGHSRRHQALVSRLLADSVTVFYDTSDEKFSDKVVLDSFMTSAARQTWFKVYDVCFKSLLRIKKENYEIINTNHSGVRISSFMCSGGFLGDIKVLGCQIFILFYNQLATDHVVSFLFMKYVYKNTFESNPCYFTGGTPTQSHVKSYTGHSVDTSPKFKPISWLKAFQFYVPRMKKERRSTDTSHKARKQAKPVHPLRFKRSVCSVCL